MTCLFDALRLANFEWRRLSAYKCQVRQKVNQQEIGGDDGAIITLTLYKLKSNQFLIDFCDSTELTDGKGCSI